MTSLTLKKEEKRTPYTQGAFVTSQQDSSSEDIFNSFQSLEVAETNLAEQKEHLTSLLNQLETKAKEAFEIRKRQVERTSSEVSDLKRKCEKLANWISTSSQLECSQAGP
jgi:hypothetical protein